MDRWSQSEVITAALWGMLIFLLVDKMFQNYSVTERRTPWEAAVETEHDEGESLCRVLFTHQVLMKDEGGRETVQYRK